LRSKQTRIIQLQSVRSTQFDLVNRALDNDWLAATFVDDMTGDQVLDQFRRRMYSSRGGGSRSEKRFVQIVHAAYESAADVPE
jgi:hypothetical protein